MHLDLGGWPDMYIYIYVHIHIHACANCLSIHDGLISPSSSEERLKLANEWCEEQGAATLEEARLGTGDGERQICRANSALLARRARSSRAARSWPTSWTSAEASSLWGSGRRPRGSP